MLARSYELREDEMVALTERPGTGPALLLTVEQAAELLQVGASTVYRLVASGEIPPSVVVRLGRMVRLHRERLELWLAQKADEGG